MALYRDDNLDVKMSLAFLFVFYYNVPNILKLERNTSFNYNQGTFKIF
jgi:hypothetical protein